MTGMRDGELLQVSKRRRSAVRRPAGVLRPERREAQGQEEVQCEAVVRNRRDLR